MTDQEIIKALECCSQENMCEKCPYGMACLDDKYVSIVSKDAFDLINRKNEMIDALIAGQETLQKCIAEKMEEIERLTVENLQMAASIKHLKVDVAKELAEKLKKQFEIKPHFAKSTMFVCDTVKETIDNLVKEMEEENGRIGGDAL